MSKSSRTYDLTIPANSSAFLNVTGEFYYILETDQTSFLVALEEEAADYAKLRTYRRLPDGESYDGLRIENNNGSSLTIKIVAGFGSYSDDEVAVAGSLTVNLPVPTGLPSTADVSITAASTVQVLAANTARKEAIISNLAANTQTMRIGDASAGAARGIELPPGGVVILETEAAIYAYNPGGSAESLAVLEVEA